jgi:predicted TIM-barrel fold metal-dependent hydrolase
MIKLFSTDDHLLEPPELWQTRLPAKYQDVCPRLIEDEDGLKWLVEDRQVSMPLRNEFVGGRQDDAPMGMQEQPLRREDLLPEYYDASARAEVLRKDGLIGSICFPTLPKFSGTLFLDFKDKELAGECVGAWNDFVFDEWCAAEPSFYVPMTLVSLWDPERAAQEIRTNAARGGRAVSLPENPVPLGLPSFFSESWDPMWRAIEETDTVVCMHVATSGQLTFPSPEIPWSAAIILVQANAASCFINLLFSPILRKFPKIQFVLSEGGISWVPALLERADRMLEIHTRWDDGARIEHTPTEIFQRNFTACMVVEPAAVELRHRVGIDRITFETDFPHAETTYPNTQPQVEKLFAGVPQDEVEAMASGNAMRLFRWT